MKVIEILLIIFVLLIGFLAGVLNVLAAGGSLLTLPMLIFLGLPSAEANGTNRIGILVQNITATTNFYRRGFVHTKVAFYLSIPAVIGSLIGASIAVKMTDRLFQVILAVIMLITLFFLIKKPIPEERLKKVAWETYAKKQKVLGFFVFFLIGIYGGFIQVGVGFFILLALTTIFHMSLFDSNIMKVVVVGLFIFLSLFIFIWNGQVNWLLGFILAIGNGLGAYVGSQLTIQKGEKWIKAALFVTIILMSIKLIIE
ncbi:MAG TPA: sulfite exporter TauE/SafE family protein [Massilibacterium sp.]|nr:sulfite exporter TauE/SafE family protein [Massilibacterium sp.]